MKARAVAPVVLSVLLSACPKAEQPRSAPVVSPSASPSASASPTPSPGLPSSERFLFESTKRPPAAHSIHSFYLSDPLSLRRQRVDFPSPLGHLVASPDGRHLARFSGRTLWTASADRPARFRRIATARGSSQAMMAQVVWDRDSSMLVYLTWRAVGPADQPFLDFVNEVYTTRFDGSRKHLVRRFSEPNQVVLRAYEAARNRLFWFETGDGGYEGSLTQIDTISGNVVATYPELKTDLYSSFGVTPDLEKAYYGKFDSIGEFSLRTRALKTLYRIPRGKDPHSDESSILYSIIRPGAATIVFTVRDDESDKEITFQIDSRTRRRSTVFERAGYYNLGVEAVSPSGRYLWLKTLCLGCGQEHGYDNRGKQYVFDTKTKQLILAAEESEAEHLTIQLLCWLRV